jgi:septum formation protein
MIILASSSPRRRELLETVGYVFEVKPSNFDESALKSAGLPPQLLVEKLAHEKARDVARACGSSDAIVGADTVVVLDGATLGKPADEQDAVRMLRLLSGNTHQVFTGVSIIAGSHEVSFSERTDVEFYDLSDKEIRDYVATGEPLDKAGAYGIQRKGALLVRGIRGDYFNVVGLPIARLARELSKLGIMPSAVARPAGTETR